MNKLLPATGTEDRLTEELMPDTARNLLLGLMFLVLLFSAAFVSAEVKVNALFSDHAVLQRDRALPVWGTAAPGEVVHVQFAAQDVVATTDASGDWHATLKPVSAGGPYEMTITGTNKIVVHDLLVGEVWIASGQSNMGFLLGETSNVDAELPVADLPQLRVFKVPQHPMATPDSKLLGAWSVSTPQNARIFTAVGYFFGAALQRDLHIPIGIINASVGGTPAEAWTSLSVMSADSLFSAMAKKESAELLDPAFDPARVKAALAAWEKKYDTADPGNTGFAKGYASPKAVIRNWQTVTLPTNGKTMGVTGEAAVWIRREITLPDRKYDMLGRAELGPLTEAHVVYFDGVMIGNAPNSDAPTGNNTNYRIPLELLHGGTHTIAARIFTHQPALMRLGFSGMALTVPSSAGGHDSLNIPLTGPWNLSLEFQKPVPESAMASQPRMQNLRLSQLATSLYNGEIYPLGNYAVRGAIWYQGEDNAERSASYEPLMTHLIASWRAQFGQNFPFYLVQLPNLNGRTGWELLRDQQQRITKAVPDTAMAVTIDVGDKDNIHPANKKPVGERLALLARHRVYGEAIEDSGPSYVSMTIAKDTITLQMAHADGLHASGTTIPNFTIAGKDKNFLRATAKIVGAKIVVSSPDVKSPVAVRYAWIQDPEGCDVYNAANLPMAPFRTDDWELPVQAPWH